MTTATVVVTSYEQPGLVPQAIRRLSRSFFAHELEVIVVDDCSQSPLIPILSTLAHESDRFGHASMVRLRENSGVAAARNVGLELASSPFVSFCDGDDLWLDGWENAVNLLRLSENIVAIGTGIREWTGEDEPDTDHFRERISPANLLFPLECFPPANQCLMTRRVAAPRFREAMDRPCELWEEPPGLEDVAWWIEVCAAGSVLWSGGYRVFRVLDKPKWYSSGFKGVAAFVVSRPDLFVDSLVERASAEFERKMNVKAVMRPRDELPAFDELFRW